MKTKIYNLGFLFLLFGVTIFSFSCNNQNYKDPNLNNEIEIKISNPTFIENFEAGLKSEYTTNTANFNSGTWTLTDAIVGTLTNDKKNGEKSVRLENLGKLTMNFDKLNGAGDVEIKYAVYGTDAESSWELYVSSDSGSTWTKVGNTVICTNNSLISQTFTVNKSGKVRFQIRKTSGGSARLNFDDFAVNDYQDSIVPSLSITPTDSTIIADAATISVSVTANVSWAASSNQTWCALSSTTGTNNGTVIAAIAQNTTTSERTATITFSAVGLSNQTLTITQAAGSSTPSFTDGDHMLMGNPSGAVTSTSYPTNYLMVKPQYVLSYNNTKHETNWTSWYLGNSWLGSAARQNDFRPDATLPSGWYQCTSSEFSGSGFDRGHMCPSADRTSSTTDNSATFLMTNMIPQAPNNNQITWANLENYERALVSQGYELYIIAGPYGQGGIGSASTSVVNTVGNGVVVPAYTWKIIVVLTNGNNDLSRVSTSTRVITVIMPNTQTCNAHPWYYYRTSVDDIETKTGFDFLSNVSTSIQSVIEATVDNGPTS